MKICKTIVIISAFCWLTKVDAQKSLEVKKFREKETITEELKFNKKSVDNILVVDNVYGSIAVEGYQGNTIKVEVLKTIGADTKEDLLKGKSEIGITSKTNKNTIYVYLDSPYTNFNIETGEFDYREHSWNYRKNHEHRKKRMYRYRLDFKIKIPKNTSIDIKAVNNGDITVKDVQGKLLIVSNINGAIDMKNVSGTTDVNALNKDIKITYSENPKEESFYNSLNGDINIKFKKDLNASITYKTMNGGFYTNFDVTNMAPEIKTIKEKDGKSTKYKINSNKNFKIGNGKVHLHFNQLNGDAIVKK